MDDVANRQGVTDTHRAVELSAMIETAIEQTAKFHVIERAQMGKLVTEQNAANSGMVTTNTPGKTGGFEGADFLIYGSITSIGRKVENNMGATLMGSLLTPRPGYVVNNGKHSTFVQTGPAPAVNCSNTFVTLGMDIQIVSASTGEVRYVKHLDETAKSETACNQQAQIDTQALFQSAAQHIASGLVQSIYPIQVAAVQSDGQIVVNYGEGTLTVGQVLGLYAKGAAIKDPATGEVISQDETQLGYARVESVTGRVSRLVPVSPMSAPPPIGTIARLATPEELQALKDHHR